MTPFERRLAALERRSAPGAAVPVITRAYLASLSPIELVDSFRRAIRGEIRYEPPDEPNLGPVPTRAQIEAMSPAERVAAYRALVRPPAAEQLA